MYLNINNLISIVSLVCTILLSILTYVQTERFNAYKKKQDSKNGNISDKIRKWQKQTSENKLELQKINNRERITPYFNLVLDNKNITYHNGQLKLKIGLINTGINTVTSICIPYFKTPKDANDAEYSFFGTKSWYGNIHKYSDYLSEIYAFPKDKVYFGITPDWKKLKHVKNYENHYPGHHTANVSFKIHFTDAMGRKYEQICTFLYEANIQQGSLVNASFGLERSVTPPRLISND